MKYQKSQSGMNAAVLVAIISALIIIYIIFLPSEERSDLIGENDSNGKTTDSGAKLLLDEKELVMQHIDNDEIEHDIGSVNLFTKTEAKVLREETSVYVKNGIFDKEGKEIQFSVTNQENTKNILISFDVKKAKGRLVLTLNNHEIFNGELKLFNAEPVKVPSEFISSSNTLNIEVSGVGIAFWSTNEYLLDNLQITADITDTSTRESELTFILPQSESSNIEKAELRFVPECRPDNVGTLEILVNNHQIYSSIPDCGTPRPFDFSSAHLITGENKLVFRTDKGRYLIDQIKVTTKLKETPSYTFYFDIDEDDFGDIQADKKIANLTFYFTDDIEDKEAELIINGRKTFMTRHHKFAWSLSLNKYVDEGSNSLKVLPETKLEIRKLQIKLQDKD